LVFILAWQVRHLGEFGLGKIPWKQFDGKNQVQTICSGEVKQLVEVHTPKWTSKV